MLEDSEDMDESVFDNISLQSKPVNEIKTSKDNESQLPPKKEVKPNNKKSVELNSEKKNPISEEDVKDKDTLYKIHGNSAVIKDGDVEACFGVEQLANCYFEHIDNAAGMASNTAIFGLYGAWGRGKTYFFNELQKLIFNRNNKIRKGKDDTIKYDIVKFNAWKYQETPSIWAYLFETIFRSKSWCFRFFYTIKRNIKSILCNTILLYIHTHITYLSTMKLDNQIHWLLGVGGSSFVLWILKLWSANYNTAISLIKKYSKGVSFTKEMGIQAEIEKELEKLLRTWIPLKKENTESTAWYTKLGHWFYNLRFKFRNRKQKVLLYVDDIDRCNEEQMMSIIDSLRTVLENDAIRKRLVVVCSIDSQKLMKGIELKYQKIYSGSELQKTVVEQMDKIFLSGLALSILCEKDICEYVDKLSKEEIEYEKNEKGVGSIDNAEYQTKKHKIKNKEDVQKDAINTNETKVSKWRVVSEISVIELARIYKDLILKYKIESLTPRRTRIIYYRMLLANNLLTIVHPEKEVSKMIYEEIFLLSCDRKGKMQSSDEFYEIIKMVVPYSCISFKQERDNVQAKVAVNSDIKKDVDNKK
jgi:hypothetical protein